MREKENLAAYLSLDDDERVYEIIECSFGFSQGHDLTPSSRPRIDVINLTLKVEGDTTLIDWVVSQDANKKGEIRIKINESSYRKITFPRGYCVSYNERYDNYSSSSMLMSITILVEEIEVIGNSMHGITSRNYKALDIE